MTESEQADSDKHSTSVTGEKKTTPTNTAQSSEVKEAGSTRKENDQEILLDDFGLPIRPRRNASYSDVERGKDADEPAGSTGSAKKEAIVQDVAHEAPVVGQLEPETNVKTTAIGGNSSTNNVAESVSDKQKLPEDQDGKIGSADNKSNETGDSSTKPRSNSNLSSTQGGRSRSGTLAQIIEAGPDETGVSQWSHQALTTRKLEEKNEEEEEQWQQMPAYGKYDLYDDDGRLVARGVQDSDDEDDGAMRGGAKKGYTRIQLDEDAKSTTSMDENTSYLFKELGTNLQDEDEDVRDPLSQMQATKDLLTEGQRIAYVGVVRLSMMEMVKTLEAIEPTRVIRKDLQTAVESTKMWSQKMMVRLYAHMDIDSSEQIMIEQLAEHGVQPSDLTPALMQNSRVKNPMADVNGSQQDLAKEVEKSPRKSSVSSDSVKLDSPPAYELHQNEELPEVRSPGMLPATKSIDIDLRWTVLCDLFLVLIADSIYDSRSRVLLESVGKAMDIPWVDICRFEKRVTDALEMQEQEARENWDEAEHMETRRKRALKRRYMMMGLATVGGSLVIGLSAGLLAPVIGAGLAAGFSTIGIAGTSGFLAGAGGAAIITTGSAVSGGVIAVRASNRRTGAVKTFEYRPLHNNKRVNLIVTVSGWMNGNVDDVRLPFSTVDPIMGDIYSVLWEPDMLRSMGDTIRILATEALTQGLQQVLASTILTALMASLSLPIILAKLSYLIDNPWSVSLDRADAAGLILADSLIDRNLGVRPITLVGFSLGARVIFSCLRELSSRGALGIIQNVYLFGSPIVAKKDEYLKARSVVSGRFVNAYATNDWIIGYLFRATSGGIQRVAGLAAVEGIPGLENRDVTSMVNGHMAYRAMMPKLLRDLEWEVESDEFTEIEDPDPDNHEARQRELIQEIEDARKEAEAKSSAKKKTSWWRRGPKEKKGWETYEIGNDATDKSSAKKDDYNPVIFDIDAIRAELESEQIEVRQLESTLPPMQISTKGSSSASLPYSVSGQTSSTSLDKIRGASNPDLKTKLEGRLESGYPEPARPKYDEWDDYDKDTQKHSNGVTMSFEAPPSRANDHSDHPTLTLHPPTRSLSASPSPSRPSEKSERPELKSTATSPAMVGTAAAVGVGAGVGAGAAAGYGYNAWADPDEDDEFASSGKEVSMTFE